MNEKWIPTKAGLTYEHIGKQAKLGLTDDTPWLITNIKGDLIEGWPVYSGIPNKSGYPFCMRGATNGSHLGLAWYVLEEKTRGLRLITETAERLNKR